jgi:hypothetical protein
LDIPVIAGEAIAGSIAGGRDCEHVENAVASLIATQIR